MSALDSVLPTPRLQEIDEVEIAAPSEIVWDTVRHRNLAHSPLIRALFALRTLPERLAGEAPRTAAICVDELASSPEKPGFQLLVEVPPDELVVGAIGKVWQPHIPFVHVADAPAFASFREPGFIKVAWALQVEPRGETHTRLKVEVRVDATDDAAWRAFNRYFLVIGPASRVIRRLSLRSIARELRSHHASSTDTAEVHDGVRDVLEGLGGALRIAWQLITPIGRHAQSVAGLDEAQSEARFPGDELVGAPAWSWTHAIEVAASAADVWPWVAQIGATRAGFYSYQWLENLVGCNIRNADRVHPAWEAQPGEAFFVHPSAPPLTVTKLERGRYFVVHGAADEQARAAGRPWVTVSWLFQVEPLAAERCRVISRYRAAYSHHLGTRLSYGPALLRPIGSVMDRRMLMGIQSRAERARRAAYRDVRSAGDTQAHRGAAAAPQDRENHEQESTTWPST
ncbi:MAG: hypothetical protein ABW321_15610 [Polyangiales bacterium]